MNMWNYYSTVWQSSSNDLTCLESWEQTSMRFSLRVRHTGCAGEAGGLRSITGKDSPIPFRTLHNKDTRGAEATGRLSAIPQRHGLLPELPVTISPPCSLCLQPGGEPEHFKLQLVFSTKPPPVGRPSGSGAASSGVPWLEPPAWWQRTPPRTKLQQEHN